MKPTLTAEDYQRSADSLEVEVAIIKAVTAVESNGAGFIKGTDRPKILFERHIMWRRLRAHGFNPQDYLNENIDVLGPDWSREYYKGGAGEYDRLEQASKIHLQAALESASWGLFQIMGYHWKALGYESVQEFVNTMYESEGAQLDAFVRYVQVNKLTEYLRGKDWANFARRYNGPGYAENHYDTKLAAAYEKYKALTQSGGVK